MPKPSSTCFFRSRSVSSSSRRSPKVQAHQHSVSRSAQRTRAILRAPSRLATAIASSKAASASTSLPSPASVRALFECAWTSAARSIVPLVTPSSFACLVNGSVLPIAAAPTSAIAHRVVAPTQHPRSGHPCEPTMRTGSSGGGGGGGGSIHRLAIDRQHSSFRARVAMISNRATSVGRPTVGTGYTTVDRTAGRAQLLQSRQRYMY